MKKSTGIIFLLAAALGAFVYFYDMKHTPAGDADATVDSSKPAYSLAAADITNMTLERAGTMAAFEHRTDGWYMTAPMATKAEQSVLDAITSELASVRVSRTLTAAPDRMAAFGLTSPSVVVRFRMKGGAKHVLQLGAKDFSGMSVYAKVDDGKDVAMLSDAVLTSSDKPLDEFRDHTVLNFVTGEVSALDLKNASGDISATKSATGWKIEKPRAAGADDGAITGLISTVGTGRLMSFVEDATPNLAKYGLTKPAVAVHFTMTDGKSVELEIGKKDGTVYFARDAGRPGVFRVNQFLYDALEKKFFDLRDKTILHEQESDLTRAEIRNSNGTTVCTRGADNGWVVDSPADQKAKTSAAKPPDCPSFMPALEQARAKEIYDSPTAGISARLAKPAVQVALTDKAGKKTEIRISAAEGENAYARVGASPEVFKLQKSILEDLSFKSPNIKD